VDEALVEAFRLAMYIAAGPAVASALAAILIGSKGQLEKSERTMEPVTLRPPRKEKEVKW
jgi:hypothetical protein